MIQTDCPGVNAVAGHALFVTEGLAYLHEHGLVHEHGPEAPRALVLDGVFGSGLLRRKDP